MRDCTRHWSRASRRCWRSGWTPRAPSGKTPRCSPMAWACCCCSTPAASACSGRTPRPCSITISRACWRAPPVTERTCSMLLDVDESQLLLVDYQERLMPSIHEREAVLLHAVRLGRMAQMLGVPTWGTEENPTRLGPNPPELRALC